MDVQAGRRLVFLSGSRENGVTSEVAGIYDLSPIGANMFLNAVNYLMNQPALIPADVNSSGVADINDYNVIRNNFNKAGTRARATWTTTAWSVSAISATGRTTDRTSAWAPMRSCWPGWASRSLVACCWRCSAQLHWRVRWHGAAAARCAANTGGRADLVGSRGTVNARPPMGTVAGAPRWPH